MRVLFCGLGGIGQRHLRNLRRIIPPHELDVHAYRVLGRTERMKDDLSIETGRSIVDDYSITVHLDINQALGVKPKAVFICNPSSLHTGLAIEAAKAGAHLFIEKPVADSLQGLDELQQIIDERHLVCCIGYNFRFHPALIRIKELLLQHHFGTLLAMHLEIGEYLPSWHRYEDYRTMYASRADMGGGVILSQIHEMDLIYWFFGLPSSIYTLGGKLSHLEVDVEDTASSLMMYEGSLGRFPITLHQDYLQRPPVRRLKIVGDGGLAVVDMIRNKLTVCNAEGDTVDQWDGSGFQRNDMYQAQMQHFLECVARKAKPRVGLHDGIQSLKLALAAKKSLARQALVQVGGDRGT
jgi:predicted dehydrogenase